MGLNFAISLGLTNGLYSRNWTQQSTPFDPASIDFHVKSRTGLTLIDSKSSGNPLLLTPIITTSGSPNYLNSGIKAYSNTIWVCKGRLKTTLASKWHGAQSTGNNVRLGFGTGTVKDTINLYWGDKTAEVLNNKAHDFDWHLFIVYDKRLWILDKDTLVTDVSILNIINTVSPDINVSTATWSGVEADILYGGIAFPSYISMDIAFGFIGRNIDNVITWDSKIFFGGNRIYAYNSIDGNTLTWSTANSVELSYNLNGSSHLIEKGYSLYYINNERAIVPNLLNGTKITNPTLAANSIFGGDYGSQSLYILDCIIRFTQDFFDRSNTTIYSDLARLGYYDVNNKKDWHGTELNVFSGYNLFNEGYKMTLFVKYADKTTNDLPSEIFKYPSDITITNAVSNKSYCNEVFPFEYTVTQLTNHIEHKVGNKIFGYGNDTIFYSNNNGGSYKTQSFANAPYIGMGYIFANGKIIFSDKSKFYSTDDDFNSITELDVNYNGSPFPIVVGAKNFINVRYIDYQILDSGKELITFTVYSNVIGNNYVCLLSSIDGETIETAYMFGKNPQYGNFGDPLNPVIARHTHSSTFSQLTKKWYWNTGDHAYLTTNYECHFFESVYDEDSGTWDHTKLLSSDTNSRVKAGALFQDIGNIYFGSDANAISKEMGLFKSEESDLGVLLKHIRLFNDSDNILSGIAITPSLGVVFEAGVAYNAGKYRMLIFNKNKASHYTKIDFEFNPEQTDPDGFVAWKLIKISDQEVLANVMNLSTGQYIYNTLKLNI